MSYDIVKSISIVDDKVYFTSAANNVSPRTFERFESEYFSRLYQDGGLEKLLPAVAANIWEGNFHMQNGSKLATSLNEGYIKLANTPYMRNFLDTERAAQYITDYALYLVRKAPEPDLKKLMALRNDKEAVLDICTKNPMAFDYASEDIRRDREAAKKHILTNSDKLLFNMPSYFRDDKELALLALYNNGCIYRHLNHNLQADKDVIRLAFNSFLKRRFFEHLPDLIPDALRHDGSFMTELIAACPKMHVFRDTTLLRNEDFTKTWLAGNEWHVSDLKLIPYRQLQKSEIQDYIYNRYKSDPIMLDKVKAELQLCGVALSKPNLDSIINSAGSKKSVSNQYSKSIDPFEQSR